MKIWTMLFLDRHRDPVVKLHQGTEADVRAQMERELLEEARHQTAVKWTAHGECYFANTYEEGPHAVLELHELDIPDAKGYQP